MSKKVKAVNEKLMTEYIKFRVTTSEKSQFIALKEKLGLSLSELIRLKLRGHKIPVRKTELEMELMMQLFMESNRWQKLANMYNKRDPKLANEIRVLINEFRVIIQKKF